MKIGKVPGPSELCAEMILASRDIGIRVSMEHCQRILDGKGMPADWANSVGILAFKGKEHFLNCGVYRGVKLLERAMKSVEEVLENSDNDG